MATVAQLDKDGFFLYLDNDLNGLAYGAIYELPPDTELPENHKWQWSGDQYQPIEDYRGKTAYRADGSNYQVKEYGSLPEGHSLTAPVIEPSLADKIAEAQAPFIEQQALAKSDFITARIEDDPEWEAEAQAEYHESQKAMSAAITQVVGGNYE